MNMVRSYVVRSKGTSYKTPCMVDFTVVFLCSFLYNSDFRGMMAQGIANANHNALSLFEFLYTIVIDFDIKNIVRETNSVKQAFLWLANMREITSV